jgi:copper transport protein
MKHLRLLTPFFLSIALAWAWVIPAQAHSMLVRAVPAENAVLASAPARVDLYFSEAAAAGLSKINVLDGMGNAVDAGDSQVDPADNTHLSVTLQPLGDGVYTVVWETVSATDGHQTRGSYPFSVGRAGPAMMSPARLPAGDAPLPLGMMVMKGLLYLAAAALMGRILFIMAVWEPALRQAGVLPADLPADRRAARGLAVAALVTLAAADLLSLLLQAGQDSGAWIGWPWQPTFLTILFGTRVGWLGLARIGIALLLAGLLLPRPNRWNRWMGLAVSLGLMLTFSLESHAAADPAPLMPVLADWVHMLAVSVWVGGLFTFLAGMQRIRTLDPEVRTRLTALLIPHFSTLALASVGALTVTGLYAAVLRLGSLDALWTTPYGDALILKLAIALPMVGLGAINFLFTTPNMRRAARQSGGNPAQVLRFRRLLTAEVILGVGILAWVGVFTSLAPAQSAAVPAGYHAITRADDLQVALTIDPGKAGMNTFNVTVTSGGRPVLDAQSVSLEFIATSGMVPPAKAALSSTGPGTYNLTGGNLAMPEKWDVKVVVIRPGKFDAYADFKVDFSQMGPQAMVK